MGWDGMASVVLCAQSMASGMRGWVAIEFFCGAGICTRYPKSKGGQKSVFAPLHAFCCFFSFIYISSLLGR